MGLFGILFFIIAFAFLLVFVIGMSILSALFGGISNILNLLRLGKSTARNRQQRGNTQSRESYTESTAGSGSFAASNGKIFSADEGTYVDFEEIKS